MVSIPFGTREQVDAKVQSHFISACSVFTHRRSMDFIVSYSTYDDCAGKYLSYVEWSRKTSARVTLQSASAKKPRTWRLANKGNNGVVTLEAVRSLLHAALYAVGRVQ